MYLIKKSLILNHTPSRYKTLCDVTGHVKLNSYLKNSVITILIIRLRISQYYMLINYH